jgi:hypothetical protein
VRTTTAPTTTTAPSDLSFDLVHVGCSRSRRTGDARMVRTHTRPDADGVWLDFACTKCATTVSLRVAAAVQS